MGLRMLVPGSEVFSLAVPRSWKLHALRKQRMRSTEETSGLEEILSRELPRRVPQNFCNCEFVAFQAIEVPVFSIVKICHYVRTIPLLYVAREDC